MSKSCKQTVYAILALLAISILLLLGKILFFSGLFTPLLELNGDEYIEIEVNSEYIDEGAKARYRFQDYSDNIVKEGNLNTSILGEYIMRYTFTEYQIARTRHIRVVDTTAPLLKLAGTSTMRVFQNEEFSDPGSSAIDAYDGDISAHIQVDSNVDTSKLGMYTIMYSVNDTSGNTATITRNVEVCSDPTATKLYYNHDSYDNTSEEWWFRKSENHERNTACREDTFLAKYDAYFQGEDEKVLYLTFDEGGNDITYIREIANVLKENDVQATYFLTRNYIKQNEQFMNDLVAGGNVIGNHTWHHYDMSTIANANDIDKFVLEITETEKTYMQVTGQPMKKVFRFPKGGMSERGLKIVQDLGYTNYFWSHAYYDYASDVSQSEALKTLMDHYHNGAIYLLHPSNKGNYLAMDEFIKNMKELGYTFKTVDQIPEALNNQS